MKKALVFFVFVLAVFMALLSCTKNESPTTPAATNTPGLPTATNTATVPAVTNTETNTATNTQTDTDTPTNTLTFTVTDTATITPTYTDSPTSTLTSTVTETPNATRTAVAGLLNTNFVSVPGGTYTQSDGGNNFSHTISSFKIGQYEVTYELWYMVYQWAISNGYIFANAGREGNDGTIGAAPTAAKYEPVTTINWRDMIVWCNAYSEMTGLTPVYCSDAGFTIPIKNSTDGAYGSSINTTPGSFDKPYVNWSANGYRLPTEGEWQYAASYIDGTNWTPYNYASGDTTPYNTSSTIGDYCWYNTNSGNVTHNVAGKTANALGIYDMSGNVYERCWDWSGSYPTSAVVDYRGPEDGTSREIRGGGFNNDSVYMQVGFRNYSAPYYEIGNIGFRLAKSN